MIAASSIKGLFPKGGHSENLVEFVDLAPTFYEAAGVDVGSKHFDYLDGSSLWKSVKQNQREYIIGEMNHVVGPRAYMRSTDFAKLQLKELQLLANVHFSAYGSEQIAKQNYSVLSPLLK